MKRLRKNCSGFTLVEIMVTFTLTTIFMTSAALVLTTFMHSHTVASAVATEQDVASIVMETVTGALSAAQYEEKIFSDDPGAAKPDGGELFGLTDPDQKEECSLLIQEDASGNSVVWFVDGESRNVVKMYLKSAGEEADAGYYLAMDYFVRPVKADGTVDPTAFWEAVPWQLGTGAYQNCILSRFTVDWPKDGSNVFDDASCLEVTLAVKNGLAGEDNSFLLKRSFDCYNLAPENIVFQ